MRRLAAEIERFHDGFHVFCNHRISPPGEKPVFCGVRVFILSPNVNTVPIPKQAGRDDRTPHQHRSWP